MTRLHRAGVLGIFVLLAACGPRELILEGERIGLREALVGVVADEPLAPESIPAIKLPATTALTEWTQVGGNAAHLTPHLALSATPQPVWRADIGAGNGRKAQLTATPVVAGGRIYTLDSQAGVMAHGLDGAPLWRTDLTPAADKPGEASGGGLAYGDGKLFVTTGFGRLTALDPASGRVVWVQDTDAVLSGAPTYADGLVYAVSRENVAWAIRAEDGRVMWQLPGTPSITGFAGASAPALTDRVVVFPFASSELIASLKKSGIRVWASAVSGQRRGRVYANVSDITGDPVVTGRTIYAASQSGRTVALKAASGERLWTAEEGAYSRVLPVGNSVFLVSDEARLIRLDATTGQTIWARELPYFTKEKVKKRASVYSHFGPILAGGRLVVASDDGLVRFFAPETGEMTGQIELPGGAASDPVVVGGVLYLVSGDGKLHAFR